MLLQICLFSLGAYALYIRWKNRKFYEIAKQFPSNMRRVPILEHAVNFMGNTEDRMKTIKRMGEEAIYDNDGISSYWFGGKFIVMIGDPEAAEVVMKTCLEKDVILNLAHKLIGNASVFAPVSDWRPRRKLLALNFGQKTLNSFVKIFSKQAQILSEHLNGDGNGNVSLFEKFTKYSMDSSCETTLGIELNSQRTLKNPVVESFYQFCALAAERLFKPWLHLDFIYKWHRDYEKFESSAEFLKKYVSQIIKSKRQTNETINKSSDKVNSDCNTESGQKFTTSESLLEILIKSGGEKGFTDLELQEETLMLLFAGTDTISVTISFTSLLLAKYPHIQDRVYQEINSVIGDTERDIDPDDLPKLKYLEAVVKEALRLYPPAPLLIRKVDKDVTLPSGVSLVPGMSVLINIWGIHRNPKYWGPDATVFRPERFLEGPLKHPSAYMAFSCGPRNCLGYQYAMMSLKTVMSHLLRRYRILSATISDGAVVNKADDELPVLYEVMMKPSGNIKLQLGLRN